MSIKLKRIIAAALSTALSLLLALVLLYSLDSDDETVEFVDSREDLDQLLEERSGGRPGEEAPGFGEGPAPLLLREPIPEEDAQKIFPQLVHNKRRNIYDPEVYFQSRPSTTWHCRFSEHPQGEWEIPCNNYGFRDEKNVLPGKPDLRLLVTGDSHAEGVVPTNETFTKVLGTEIAAKHPGLTVEALNAARGGYSFYNYLGVIEKHCSLEPDVFIMAVFGGNDFKDIMSMIRYFNRLPPPSYLPGWEERTTRARELSFAAFAQEFAQVLYFHQHPAHKRMVIESARAVTAEAARLCSEKGIRFIFVYIPPFIATQPGLVQTDLEPLFEILGLEREDLEFTDRLADEFLGALREDGILVVDMRDIFRDTPEPVYWQKDHHINTLGHRLVALALLPLVEQAIR